MAETTVVRVRKITTKAVYGKIDRKELMKTGELALMRVAGVARKTKLVTTDYGDSVAFLGEFGAVKADDSSKEFRSSKMYLPKVAEEMLDGAVGEGKEAEFVLDVFVIADDSTVGYFYDVRPALAPQESDVASRLLKTLSAGVGGKVPALSAPVDKATGEVKEPAKASTKPKGKK